MPSIGLDVKSGRGWGFTRDSKIHALNLGCFCFWWLSGALVTEQLLADQVALSAARDALQALHGETVLHRAKNGQFMSISKIGQ